MTLLDWIVLAIAVTAVTALVVLLRRRSQAPITPGPRRVLFPFFGSSLAVSALEAAIRLCRAEDATLVPAYLAKVPLSMRLDAPLPRQADEAMPVLEAIEQKALSWGVPVDSRIERGRSFRHAMLELVAHEDYDQIVVAASAMNGDGFGAGDVAWLLEHIPGEIVILRPSSPAVETPGLIESRPNLNGNGPHGQEAPSAETPARATAGGFVRSLGD